MSEVAAASEEAREQIERIVVLSSATTLLMLFQTLMAVLIVDPSSLRVEERLVCFGDFDELLLGLLVAPSRRPSAAY